MLLEDRLEPLHLVVAEQVGRRQGGEAQQLGLLDASFGAAHRGLDGEWG
jgi:hypothetical protein